MKIYLSITTFPKRIKYFKDFYDNVFNNFSIKPDKIILNTYDLSLRGDELIVPNEIHNLGNLMILKHTKDYGPILKFLPIFENFIEDDDIFIYCDDDIIYSNNWLELIIQSVKKYSNHISGISINSGVNIVNRFRYLKYNTNNAFLRGYGGIGMKKSIIYNLDKDEIVNILEKLNDIDLYFSDDLLISYFINKYNLKCIKINCNIKTILKENNYNKISNDSISKGVNNQIVSNKKRYYNLCCKYNFIGNYFNIYNYFKNNSEYYDELNKLYHKIKNKNNFCFLRFGNGKIRSIRDKNYLSVNNEWELNIDDKKFINHLKESLLFNDINYIKGIPCICCEEKDKFRYYLENDLKLNINLKNYTFANLFNNSNYIYFKQKIYPLFKNYKIILISNEKSNVNNLNLNIIKWFSIKPNAHKKYEILLKKILEYVKINKIENHLFLFCAGALSNVLIYELFKINKNNIYLDIGSILDNKLGLKNSRNYNSWFGWKSIVNCSFYKSNKNYNITCYSHDKYQFTRLLLRIYAFFLNIINLLILIFYKY